MEPTIDINTKHESTIQGVQRVQDKLASGSYTLGDNRITMIAA